MKSHAIAILLFALLIAHNALADEDDLSGCSISYGLNPQNTRNAQFSLSASDENGKPIYFVNIAYDTDSQNSPSESINLKSVSTVTYDYSDLVHSEKKKIFNAALNTSSPSGKTISCSTTVDLSSVKIGSDPQCTISLNEIDGIEQIDQVGRAGEFYYSATDNDNDIETVALNFGDGTNTPLSQNSNIIKHKFAGDAPSYDLTMNMEDYELNYGECTVNFVLQKPACEITAQPYTSPSYERSAQFTIQKLEDIPKNASYQLTISDGLAPILLTNPHQGTIIQSGPSRFAGNDTFIAKLLITNHAKTRIWECETNLSFPPIPEIFLEKNLAAITISAPQTEYQIENTGAIGLTITIERKDPSVSKVTYNATALAPGKNEADIPFASPSPGVALFPAPGSNPNVVVRQISWQEKTYLPGIYFVSAQIEQIKNSQFREISGAETLRQDNTSQQSLVFYTNRKTQTPEINEMLAVLTALACVAIIGAKGQKKII